MTTPGHQQFLRRANLIVVDGEKGLDLSELRFVFDVHAGDVQSPNNASIRVYNLTDQTIRKIREEYSRVVLQAGYERSAYGVIFDGTIKQIRIGRENALNTFVDILAAENDVGYNFGIVNRTFAAGSTGADHARVAAQAMGTSIGYLPPNLAGTNPAALSRGKVAFGMARDMMRKTAVTNGSTWSIQGGRVNVIPLQGYLPGEALVLNSLTGMIGIPEQTDVGIRVRSLLNPKIRIGSTIRLNNKDITQLLQKNPNDPVPFNQWTGIQYAAKIADGVDGLYRVYVAEHNGDTRGHNWYTDLICLAIDQASGKVESKR